MASTGALGVSLAECFSMELANAVRPEDNVISISLSSGGLFETKLLYLYKL